MGLGVSLLVSIEELNIALNRLIHKLHALRNLNGSAFQTTSEARCKLESKRLARFAQRPLGLAGAFVQKLTV